MATQNKSNPNKAAVLKFPSCNFTLVGEICRLLFYEEPSNYVLEKSSQCKTGSGNSCFRVVFSQTEHNMPSHCVFLSNTSTNHLNMTGQEQ